MKNYINHIFAVDAPELTTHLAKFAVGKDVGGGWTVTELKQIDVPPHPQTGETCTQVMATIEKPGDEPVEPPTAGPGISSPPPPPPAA